MTTTTLIAPPTDAFERQSCSRCGGSGNYSYCEMHGTTCFGCGGSGKTLTKRGHVAYEFFISSLQKPISDVAAGDLVRVSGMRKFARVLSASIRERAACANGVWYDYVNLEFPKSNYSASKTSTVQSIKSDAERVEKLRAAFAHQATLTKTGKVRAR